MADVRAIDNAAVAVRQGRIAAVGRKDTILPAHEDLEIVDCSGCILTPGLVDSHTHALFGAARSAEQEMRAAGLDYMRIAEQGGGIHASVRDFRSRSDDELLALTARRLALMASHGTTTVEIKSGYGLSVEQELRMLRLIGEVRALTPVRIVPTWLGAHEIPLELRSRTSGRVEYVRLLIDEMLPAVVDQGIAAFADVFCEPGVFTVVESRRILMAAAVLGLPGRIHADEFSNSGGAELAAELRAHSADHLAAISDTGVHALARANVVATVLPATMLFLGSDLRAPVRQMIAAGCAVAVATDFNPGTAPAGSMPHSMMLGVSRLGLSASECFIAGTVNGAAALGLAGSTGQIAPGMDADLAIFEADDFRELPYWHADRLCRGSWVRGKTCHPFELSRSLDVSSSNSASS